MEKDVKDKCPLFNHLYPGLIFITSSPYKKFLPQNLRTNHEKGVSTSL